MATTQDLGSDSSDETLITTVGAKGTLSVNDSFGSVASTGYLNEPVSRERNKKDLFHIRDFINKGGNSV